MDKLKQEQDRIARLQSENHAALKAAQEGTEEDGWQTFEKTPERQNMTKLINEMCAEIHDDNVKAGWWDDGKGKYVVATKVALIHSEVSEAMEGFRKDLPDKHLPHRKNAEVELADAVIRIFDLAGAHGYDLGGAIAEKRAYNAQRSDHKAENRSAEGGKAY